MLYFKTKENTKNNNNGGEIHKMILSEELIRLIGKKSKIFTSVSIFEIRAILAQLNHSRLAIPQ